MEMPLFLRRGLLFSVVHSLLAVWAVTAENVPTITGDEPGPQMIGKQVSVLFESDKEFTISDILLAENQGRFRLNDQPSIIRGESNQTFWLKLTVKNLSAIFLSWVELGSIHVWYVDYYVQRNGGYALETKSGSLQKNQNKKYNSQFPMLLLAKTAAAQTVYMRIVALPGPQIPIMIGTTPQLAKRKTFNDNLAAAFIGIMIITFVFNMFVFFVTRDIVYFWYIVYVVAALFAVSFLRHYPIVTAVLPASWHDFFYVHGSWWNFPLVFLGIFTIYFLELKKIKFLYFTTLFFVAAIGLLLPLMDFFPIASSLTLPMVSRPLIIVYSVFLLATALFIWLKRSDRNALYFLIAWSGAIGGTLTQLLTVTGKIPLNRYTENILFFGILAEVALFAIALADRLKRANQKILSHNEVLLRQTSVLAQIGGWEYFPKEQRFYWSDVTRKMYDAPEDFIPTPKNAFSFYPDRKSKLRMARAFSEALKNGTQYDIELKLTSFKKREVWIRTIGEPEFKKGICIRVFGTCQDITDRKGNEFKLIAARNAAEVAMRAKSDFLSTMSHEIRTPMSGVIGMASLLAETPLDERQHRYVDILNQSGQNLLNLLNDILDFSRMEAGKIDIAAEPFDVLAICREVAELMTPRAGQRRSVLDTLFDPAIRYNVTGDEFRLKQILSNLIGNAVKFTEDGAILISVTEVEKIGDTVTLEFMVSDTGIGIPADKIDQLFKPFTQVDGSITRRYGGTGLGLSICQRLIDLMHGQIGIESTEGAGTKVRFRLAYPTLNYTAEAVTEDSYADKEQLSRPYSVLVVDDDTVIREMLAQMLRNLGCQVEMAEDGAVAIAAYTRKRFDFVTMDTNMPQIGGHDAIQEIRKISGSSEAPTIISISASVGEAEAMRAIHIGANDIMTKPFTFNAIKNLMYRWDAILIQQNPDHG